MARHYPAATLSSTDRTSELVWDTYSRISDDPDDEQRGVGRQSQDSRAAVVGRGGLLGVEHVENDTSAYRKRRVQLSDVSGRPYYGYRVIRPVWADALHRLRTGQADGLIVYDLDRLARDPRDLEDAIEVVEHYGKTIVSATASEIDLTTESGRMTARMMVIMANKSSADTGRRVKRAALENAMNGKPTGRRAFGWAENKINLHPTEAPAVREAVSRLLDGSTTVSAIAREWNEAGIRTARGNEWNNLTVRQYLRHPRLAGYRVFWAQGDSRIREDKILYGPDGSPVMGQWEPILDAATWERLQLVLSPALDAAGRGPKKSSRAYLLSGLLRCAVPGCNAVMYANYATERGKHYYKCTASRSAASGRHTQTIVGPDTDDLVTELALAYLARQEDSPARAQPSEWPREAELRRASEKIKELMAAFNDDRLPGSVVFPQVTDWEARAAGLRADKRRWEAGVGTGPSMVLDGVVKAWPDQSQGWRRTVLESLFEAIVIKPRTITGTNIYEPERVVPIWRTTS